MTSRKLRVLFCTGNSVSGYMISIKVGEVSPSYRKANVMNIQSDWKPALLRAVGGAVALAIIGFAWGG